MKSIKPKSKFFFLLLYLINIKYYYLIIFREGILTKGDQTMQEKKAIRRKMKIRRKRINKKKEREDRIKSGLTRGEMNLLKKNKSVMEKQLKDSKKKKIEFTKTSEFFKNMQKSQS